MAEYLCRGISPDSVFDHSSFQINRLPGWRRQIHACRVLKHPSDLLKIVPCPPSGGSRRLQLIEQFLECLRSNRHAISVRMNIFRVKPYRPAEKLNKQSILPSGESD